MRPRRRRWRVHRRRRPPIPPATGSPGSGRGRSEVQLAARNVPGPAILPCAGGSSLRTCPVSPPDSLSRARSPRRGPERTPS
ncbi:unnamed protein product [Rangifer tarandus platyrhynchus]|uniref:Uncharacterized protein n=2 Tax=Rangifer tarandus platyrhynchus TaxID=3082113 RepID=A0ABN8XT57_RANTA|nr:unnamed protein product [Rangifer tarandus platyrhynchus]CAI9690689.1 unnamed protein product [Rangifer tarandus platyrhynchus]